jgi:putative mRNA 3-end processing factor
MASEEHASAVGDGPESAGLTAPLIVATDRGLYCPAGGFYIDPWRTSGVERAIVTHAHSDHAALGCGSYVVSPTCLPLLRARLGAGINARCLGWGKRERFGDVVVSLHPAGHVLGSAQVRVERVAGKAEGDEGGVWVVSGDYFCRAPDESAQPSEVRPGAEPFEPVPCDTFLTESTFGLPIYRWPADEVVCAEMNRWWLANASRGITSVIYAYSLGKAQRVLLGVDAGNGPLAAHGSVLAMNAAYSAAGIALPACMAINKETLGEIKGRGLVIAPPSAGGNNAWLRKLTGPGGVEEAMASGWMRVRGKRHWRSVATGFVLSDHADWPGLLWAIRATGATRVGVTHGSSGALARWLREHGTGAFVVPTRFKGDEDAQEEAT